MTIVDCTLLAEVNMISAGVVGLIALIVLVFAILSAKNWHWVNVVFLILTLITSITAIIGMTFAFDHRYKGMVEFKTQSDEAEKAEAKVVKIISGEPLSVQYDKDSLRYNNNQLALAMTGRGRKWREGRVEVEGDNRKFTLRNERDFALGGDGEVVKGVSFSGAIMYAFADKRRAPNSRGIPDRYIGSVVITGETGKDFTLQPVALADPGLFDDPQTTWTLYEKMPQDRHGIFKEALESRVLAVSRSDKQLSKGDEQRQAFVESMKDEATEFDIATFTNILKRDFLPAERLGYDADSVEYEQMVDQYAFDNQSVSEVEKYVRDVPGRKNREFDPDPQLVFVKFAFTATSETAVRTDGKGTLENDGMFNRAGEAVIGKLMQNPEGVTFKENDVVLIDEPSSVEFERTHAGKLKKLDRIFVRRLQDFPMMFKSRKIRIATLEAEIATSQATAEKTEAALKDTKAQIDVRTDLLAKNTEDEEGFTKDSENLKQTNESLDQRSAEMAEQIKNRKVRIESLYQQIKTRSLEKLRSAVSVSN